MRRKSDRWLVILFLGICLLVVVNAVRIQILIADQDRQDARLSQITRELCRLDQTAQQQQICKGVS